MLGITEGKNESMFIGGLGTEIKEAVCYSSRGVDGVETMWHEMCRQFTQRRKAKLMTTSNHLKDFSILNIK